MLDTHALSKLIRNPHGTLAGKLNALAPDAVCTSIVAACELRFGAQRMGSAQLTQRVEQLLQALLPSPLAGEGLGERGSRAKASAFPLSPTPLPREERVCKPRASGVVPGQATVRTPFDA
jgi:hypothetical protein